MDKHVTSPQLAFDFGPDHVAVNDPAFSSRIYRRSQTHLYSTPEWKRVVRIALERAEYHCEQCGLHKSQVIRLDVHHIVPQAIRPELFLSLGNLQVLCSDCHQNTTMQHAAKYGWHYKFKG